MPEVKLAELAQQCVAIKLLPTQLLQAFHVSFPRGALAHRALLVHAAVATRNDVQVPSRSSSLTFACSRAFRHGCARIGFSSLVNRARAALSR
jgi:hypothetical protein